MLIEQLINQQELLDALTRGATVLTGNNRLAGVLVDKFDAFNIENNNSAWSSPDVLPVNSWLVKNWENAIVSGVISSDTVLLSSEQEFQVWEAIIKDSSYGNGLLRITATAKSVSDAWHLLQNWNLQRVNSDYQTSDDARAFHYWSTEFEKRCQQENWIVISQLASLDYYPLLIKNNEIVLLGFEELTPQLQSLFEKLKLSKTFTGTVNWYSQENVELQVSRLACVDIREEIETFVIWAKQILEHKPTNRIALVIPDISSIRPQLLHKLKEILLPSSGVAFNFSGSSDIKKLDADNLTALPWDISMGLPLTDYSIIKSAFQLLSLVRGKMTIETVSSLLRSPHILGAREEQNSRALLDRHLREQGEPLVSFKTLHYYSSREGKNYYSPVLSGIIAKLIALRTECPGKANNQQWASWLNTWLMVSGWGAGRTLSSEEYQTIEAWKAVLQTFTSLQTVTGAITFEEAVSHLFRLASEKIFQIQSSTATIQILGLYESIGLDYDYLWVMNLHDEVWPISPRPNPFIPLELQKKYGLPHASWERELVIAKKITKRLACSAKNVVFSYPVKSGVQNLRVSPLIKDFNEITKDTLGLEPLHTWLQSIKQSSKLDELLSDSVASVALEKISGGSSIFKNQSLCPFRAFVENRLHARPMRKTEAGLDAMKRGSLLHAVLELFWKTITDQQQLKSQTTTQLEAVINQCIEKAITDMAIKSPDTFKDCFTRIEKQRLLQLVSYWLELEAQRAPFKVIATEREVDIDINGVKAHLFIDRVDELEDGSQMVIDYKTGQVSPTDWFGDRPNDPQLPLYSVASGDNLSAVLFAQLKTGDIKFSGVVKQESLIPDLPPTRKGILKDATEHWPTVLTDWHSVINSLASDFKQAHIDVNPKDGPVTCRKLYCELSPLCRIHELEEKNNLATSITQDDCSDE
ncbi:MAG: PD-(D/E)XK nuclease family protein [Gammaproteobacteria bacterium]